MTTTEATKRLGIDHPIVQGPFGGGLSSVELAGTVSDHGGLGSYGAQTLSPAQIVAITGELRARTQRPFAVNLWVSDHDPGGFDRDPAQLEALHELFTPYFAELGLEVPALPEHAFHPFEQQVEAGSYLYWIKKKTD